MVLYLRPEYCSVICGTPETTDNIYTNQLRGEEDLPVHVIHTRTVYFAVVTKIYRVKRSTIAQGIDQ